MLRFLLGRLLFVPPLLLGVAAVTFGLSRATGADPVVFAATDLRTPGCEDEDRCFSYGVSRDREVVEECGRLLGI